MKKTGFMVLGIMVAGISMSGCSSVLRSVTKEVISQMGENEDSDDKDAGKDRGDDHEDGEDIDEKNKDIDADEKSPGGKMEDAPGSSGSFSGGFDQFIQKELEPRLGTAKNNTFSYGFEMINYEGSSSGFASPMSASLDNGIVSTYRRDLNKDGRDELLAVYVEGSRQSGDGRNHFCLGVYGDSGNGIAEWGKIAFDDCFSGYNGEDYLFGLKDVGDKRLIYAGGSSHVWTWADGSNPQIHVYQLEGSQIREIYQVETSGSDDSWMPGWRSDLQRLGFDLPSAQWNECNLAGESGFEVLAYGECYTQGGETTNMFGDEYQKYLVKNASITGGIYGPDSQMVMQMNQSMASYAGGGSSLPYGQQGGGYSGGGSSYAGGNSGYGAGDYILPNSSTMYLSRSDLYGLSDEQLRLARNEIYARHGRKFKTKEIQDYFNSKSWYVGTIESNAFKDSYLNIYEKENIRLIQSMEK